MIALGSEGFSNLELLVMDVFHAQSGQPHPAREAKVKETSEADMEKRRVEARRRNNERKRLLAEMAEKRKEDGDG